MLRQPSRTIDQLGFWFTVQVSHFIPYSSRIWYGAQPYVCHSDFAPSCFYSLLLFAPADHLCYINAFCLAIVSGLLASTSAPLAATFAPCHSTPFLALFRFFGFAALSPQELPFEISCWVSPTRLSQRCVLRLSLAAVCDLEEVPVMAFISTA
jgi:hypothetical protein